MPVRSSGQSYLNRILSIIVSLALLLGCFPCTALAAPEQASKLIAVDEIDIGAVSDLPDIGASESLPDPAEEEDEPSSEPFGSEEEEAVQPDAPESSEPESPATEEPSQSDFEDPVSESPAAGEEQPPSDPPVIQPEVEDQSEPSATDETETPADSVGAGEKGSPENTYYAPVGKDIDGFGNILIDQTVPSVEPVTPGKEATDTPAAKLIDESSTYELNANPSKDKNQANFYIYLDDEEWVCIGTLAFTVSSSWWTYTASMSTDDILDLVNAELGAGYELSSSDFKLYRSNNTNFSNNTGYATISGNTTTLGSYNNGSSNANAAKYVRFMTPSSSNNNRTPLNFYTVTFDYPDQDDVSFIVPTGARVTMPEGYTWEAGSNTYSENQSVQVSDTTTFVGTANAPPPTYTVTCINGDSVTETAVIEGDTFTLPYLDDRYLWVSDNGAYGSGDTITVYSDLTFTATPIFYTITCINGESTTTRTVMKGDTFTLPELDDRHQWICEDDSYAGGESITVLSDLTFTAEPITYTVTLINGNSRNTSTVTKGDPFTLPELNLGYSWLCNNIAYSGGETVTILSDMTFTAKMVFSMITVNYDVNFPTGATGYYGNSFPASPTLVGTNNETTASDSVLQDNSTFIRDVSSHTVSSIGSTHGGKFTLAIYFNGWRTGNGDTIEPNSILTWDILASYDSDNDGIVTLEGIWAYSTGTTANFCVRYDSKTGQSDTSTQRYTPSLFSTYVGGTGNLSLDGTTDEAAYQVDQQIRALYGNWGGDLWLTSFPSDEYIFQELKKHTGSLTVGDKSVNAEDLNATNYAIRWYMIKKDGGDGWHIDGRLFEKKGQITVDKEFFGDETAIDQAKRNFYIEAVNSSGKRIILSPDNADAVTNEANRQSYEWLIEDVALGEAWQITEHPVSVDGYNSFSEYSVYDSDGEITALAQSGTSASVLGKIFALDEDPDQGILVDFRNFYYRTDSIFIKTEDGDTGHHLPGASYELWQVDANGVSHPLTFRYNAETNQYICDSDGSITQITSGTGAFATISTDGFSYNLGDVVFKEVLAPSGYSAAPNITLTEADGQVSIIDMTFEDGAEVSVSQWPKYGKLEENGEVLIIKNYSASPTSVTVEKIWTDSVIADSVTVVLQANNFIATNAFPGLANVQVTLSEENDWSYTWSDLPSYANGSMVEWSVKETKIGEETTLTDGVSFANWTVIYSPAVKTDDDYDGIPENWELCITNSIRRTQMFLTKTDTSGTTPLAGAEFSIVAVTWSGGKWTQISDAPVYYGVSDARGLIHFDGLVPNVYYLLTETEAPDGYSIGQESIVLTIDNSGQIFECSQGQTSGTTLNGDYHKYLSNYNITVENILQYSCTISAPDSLTFSYVSGGYIWNPETMMYEQTASYWTSDNDAISVTNTTNSPSQVYVEAVFTFEFDDTSLQDYIYLDASTAHTTARTDDSIVLTGYLAENQRMRIYVQLDEDAPAFTSESRAIGSLSIRVSSPRRRFRFIKPKRI